MSRKKSTFPETSASLKTLTQGHCSKFLINRVIIKAIGLSVETEKL